MTELIDICLFINVDVAQSLERPLPENVSDVVSRESGPIYGDMVLRLCKGCRIECEFLEDEGVQPLYVDAGLIKLKAGCLAIGQS